ncbi:hypothetical protein GCM10010193_70310 [Kitasatospora atroaurantiaca]|uniref:Uncharacterized protein n=1 Tax=Kitasatospora atroaurantiaca TaxID=285545 RepID=A0A561ENB6_9ACTN|nr:hypothetical protein [Kitasatospora atroaurantiaca]TWE17118.1 hypothetical protein FB465_2123 [Kitasatospora atroaurantiaca]
MQTGQIFGVIGSGLAALIATTVLILGCRGKGNIRFHQEGAAITGYVAGYFYSIAATFWSGAAAITGGVTAALTGPGGAFGNGGMGGVALLLAVIAYGAKLKPGLAAVLGVAAFTVFQQAGGIWATPAVIVASISGNLMGVH